MRLLSQFNYYSIICPNFLLYDTLRSNGIEIPFPQRDIHIREIKR